MCVLLDETEADLVVNKVELSTNDLVDNDLAGISDPVGGIPLALYPVALSLIVVPFLGFNSFRKHDRRRALRAFT